MAREFRGLAPARGKPIAIPGVTPGLPKSPFVMVSTKSWCTFLLLISVCIAIEAQPTDIEPILPPIPDPPYPHSVRFCGIADDASFSLNASTLNQCDWKRYGKVRKPTKHFGTGSLQEIT